MQIPFQVTDKLVAKECPGLDEFTYAKLQDGQAGQDHAAEPADPDRELLGRGRRTEAYPDPFELGTEARDVLVEWMKQLADAGCTYMQLDAPELAVAYADESFGDPNVTLTWDRPRRVPRLRHGADRVAWPRLTFRASRSACTSARATARSPGSARATTQEFSQARLRQARRLRRLPLRVRRRALRRLQAAGRPARRQVRRARHGVDEVDRRSRTRTMLKRRIDEAAQFHPKENLGISTQCGFASAARDRRGAQGHRPDPDRQAQADRRRRKRSVVSEQNLGSTPPRLAQNSYSSI